MSLTRWFIYFGMWNVAAALLFTSVHEFMEYPMVDLPLYIFILGLIAYPFLNRIVLRRSPASVGLLPRWVQGFHCLFWAEAAMEAVIFTWLDFHNTPAHDPYFMVFWICIAAWFLGGWPWLAFRQRTRRSPLNSAQ